MSDTTQDEDEKPTSPLVPALAKQLAEAAETVVLLRAENQRLAAERDALETHLRIATEGHNERLAIVENLLSALDAVKALAERRDSDETLAVCDKRFIADGIRADFLALVDDSSNMGLIDVFDACRECGTELDAIEAQHGICPDCDDKELG